MTKMETSLLLYLETCAVDNAGRFTTFRVNTDEQAIMLDWHRSGFVRFGRCKMGYQYQNQHNNWVELSDSAWEQAHKARRERANRNPVEPEAKTSETGGVF